MDNDFLVSWQDAKLCRQISGRFTSIAAAETWAEKNVAGPYLLLKVAGSGETNPLLRKQLYTGFKNPGFAFECSGQRAHNPDTTFILLLVSNGKFKLFAPPENGRYFDDTFDNSQTVQDVVNFLSEQYRSVKVRQGTWQIL